jgi:hypothetical protein
MGDKNLDPGVLTDDERYIYYEILLKLEGSDIVWPRYGEQTREELALDILRKIQICSSIVPTWLNPYV